MDKTPIGPNDTRLARQAFMKAKGPMVYNDLPGRMVQLSLSGSVGHSCENDRDDVKCVQSLLNRYNSVSALAVDGLVGPKTLSAIATFQRSQLGFADQRID